MGKLITESDSGTTQRLLFLPETGIQISSRRSICSETVKFRLSPDGELSRLESCSRTQLIEFPD